MWLLTAAGWLSVSWAGGLILHKHSLRLVFHSYLVKFLKDGHRTWIWAKWAGAKQGVHEDCGGRCPYPGVARVGNPMDYRARLRPSGLSVFLKTLNTAPWDCWLESLWTNIKHWRSFQLEVTLPSRKTFVGVLFLFPLLLSLGLLRVESGYWARSPALVRCQASHSAWDSSHKCYLNVDVNGVGL